jgi:hypothetical protein
MYIHVYIPGSSFFSVLANTLVSSSVGLGPFMGVGGGDFSSLNHSGFAASGLFSILFGSPIALPSPSMAGGMVSTGAGGFLFSCMYLICICMYLCAFIYIYTYIYIYIYIYIHTCTSIYQQIEMQTHIHTSKAFCLFISFVINSWRSSSNFCWAYIAINSCLRTYVVAMLASTWACGDDVYLKKLQQKRYKQLLIRTRHKYNDLNKKHNKWPVIDDKIKQKTDYK